LGKTDNRKLLRHISKPPQSCIFITPRHNSKVNKRPKKSTQPWKPPKHPWLPTDRIEYSPITERPPLKFPDGSRMAVWVIVAVEEWDPTQPMPHGSNSARWRVAHARRAELGVARIRQQSGLLALYQGF
jgi:hypothetical protein